MSNIRDAEDELLIGAAVGGPTAAAEPRGIGGWLLLVAFGQVVGPLQMLVLLGQHYLDPENLKVFDQYPLAMYGELVMNAAMLLLVVTTAVLFFRKSRYFPRFFIAELVAVVILPILDTVWVALMFSIQLGTPISENLLLEPQDIAQISLAVIAALIWIPYTLRSKRVKNTFDPRNAPIGATNAGQEEQAVVLLRAVVYAVVALGVISLLAGVGHLIGRGAFSGQLMGGALQIALAIWLFRGSDIARIVLALLFSLGLVLSAGLAFVIPYQDLTPVVLMLAMAIICGAIIWALVFSNRFRAELAINAARYRRPDPEEA